MIRMLGYSLFPLALLVMLAVFACLLGYMVLQLAGDILPLDKLISKSTQILLILSIFPLKKRLNLSWPDLGFAPKQIFFRQFFQGLLLSIITLLPVFLILYALNVHVVDASHSWTGGKIAVKIGLALLFAVLIAVSEETLFRGLLLTGLRQKMTGCAAIFISSVYYAELHFLKGTSSVAYADITPISGFQLMAEAFGNWLNPEIFSALSALFVVGLFLALLRSRIPQSLWICIGCHCGWVWQIKVSKDLFNVNPQSDYLFLVSSYDGVIGPLVCIWLSVALLGFYLVNRNYSTRFKAG